MPVSKGELDASTSKVLILRDFEKSASTESTYNVLSAAGVFNYSEFYASNYVGGENLENVFNTRGIHIGSFYSCTNCPTNYGSFVAFSFPAASFGIMFAIGTQTVSYVTKHLFVKIKYNGSIEGWIDVGGM